MKRQAILLSLSLVGACGGSVDAPASTSTSTGTSTTSSGKPCSGESPGECTDNCGYGYSFGMASCVNGTWTCPGNSAWDHSDCCGLVGPCESCTMGGFLDCDPTEDCIEASGGIVCTQCVLASLTQIGVWSCTCNAASQLECSLTAGCCNADTDCGDALLVPCIEHVCKQPVPDACWSSVECKPNETCVGATVCPCGALCDGPDQPGTCTPG